MVRFLTFILLYANKDDVVVTRKCAAALLEKEARDANTISDDEPVWEHSSRWARIESISAVDNHPYHFIAHPTFPAVPDIHATFATLARCFRCSPYFCNLRISAHYVAPRANPSRLLPIMSIRFPGA